MNSTHASIQTNPAIGDRGLIDIYLPENAAFPCPFVLGIHGGGWRNGDRTSYQWMWPRLQPHGFALVTCSYRLAPAHPFPAACDDLLHLFSWLGENAGRYGLDAQRCVAVGGSAGGHMVMLTGLKATAEGCRLGLRGLVDYCGIMDLASQSEFDEQRASPMTKDFLGGTPAEKAEACAAASPLLQVHAACPPVWMAHGDSDGTVPVEQSRKMKAALEQAGVKVTYREAEGLAHTMTEPPARPDAAPVFLFEESLLAFLRERLA
jgi:acetyl esterase/lipase